MGLPVHAISLEFREIWVDSLRHELTGYATVEISNDPIEEEEIGAEITVTGNHGSFTLRPYYDEPSCFLLLISPFYCSVKTHGQEMVNLEERIHRVFDKMSIALMPEAIERYEKSRWTKFFRFFGLEHVGSLDFAHRPKREIIDDFDTERK